MAEPVSIGKQLTLQRIPGVGGTLFRLVGAIDDSFEGARVLEGAQAVTVFDLDGVSRITSYGVREWITMLRALPAESYYCFVRCRPSMVSQFNMVNQFGGRGVLITFYAPYLCTECDHSFEVLFDLRTQYADAAAAKADDLICPMCKGRAEFDDIPESYFEYVASAPQPNPSPRINALIDGEKGVASTPLKIDKEVEEQLTFLWLSGDLDRPAHFKRLADGLEGKIVLVLSRVTLFPDAGLQGFSTFLQTPGLELFLARVPWTLAMALADRPQGCGVAKVISLMMPFRCESHGDFLQEVSGASLISEPPSFISPLCPSCRSIGTLECTPEQLNKLRLLPLQSPPPDVQKGLQTRPAGPLIVSRPLSSNPQADAPSDNAFGRYQLVRRIGLGGMAEVFLARQLGPMGFEKRVVLKRILPQYSTQTAFIEMFLEEARLAARISHSNVVQIFDLGQVGDQFFIAMEHVPGRDLALILRLAKELGIAMPVDVACRIVMGICAGLHAAHTSQDNENKPVVIVHRDVSPHNVLVSTDGTVKVTDFGIATVAHAVGKTDPGTVKGKIGYLAPEVFTERRTLDRRVDIFATGVIFFQALTHKPPFFRSTDAATMRAILQEPTPSLLAFRPELPPALDAVVARALAKSPDDRYATAKEMEVAIEGFLRAYTVSSPTRVAEWIQDLLMQAQGTGVESLTDLSTFTPSIITQTRGTLSQSRAGENTDAGAPAVAGVASKSDD